MATQIVMDHSGDSRHFFDQNDPASIALAERRFGKLTGHGYTATVRSATGDLRVVRTFDPTMEETLFYPRLVGG